MGKYDVKACPVPSRRSTTGPGPGDDVAGLADETVSLMGTPCLDLDCCAAWHGDSRSGDEDGPMNANGVTRPVRPTPTRMSKGYFGDLFWRVCRRQRGARRWIRGGAGLRCRRPSQRCRRSVLTSAVLAPSRRSARGPASNRRRARYDLSTPAGPIHPVPVGVVQAVGRQPCV